MKGQKVINTKLTEHELEKIEVERHVQGLFTRDECRAAVLNAARYLEVNGTKGLVSDSAIDMLSAIALAFAAGELDWVKDLERDEE